jgi:hypothetical protein
MSREKNMARESESSKNCCQRAALLLTGLEIKRRVARLMLSDVVQQSVELGQGN